MTTLGFLSRRLAGILLLALGLLCVGNDPGSAAVAPGDVLYTDVFGHDVLVYSPASGTTMPVASDGLLSQPTGIAVESPTTILVSNVGASRIVRIRLDDGSQATVSEGGLLAGYPQGIVTWGHHAYVATLTAGIVEVDLGNGSQRQVSSGGDLIEPTFLALYQPGKLVVTAKYKVLEVDITTGEQRHIAGGQSRGVALDVYGGLILADFQAFSVWRYLEGVSLGILAYNIPWAWGLALDEMGNAYVSGYAQQGTTPRLYRVNLSTGTKEILPIPAGVQPYGVAVFIPPNVLDVDPPATVGIDVAMAPAPNPAHSSTQVGFVVGAHASEGLVPVSARIVDVRGRQVRSVNLGRFPTGSHRFAWDLRNDRGARVGAGVYRVTLAIGTQRFARNVVVLP